MMTATGVVGERGGRPVLLSNSSGRQRVEGFAGTSNPRQLRVILALLRRPMTREQVDREAGCSNGPDLVANLRALGLDIPCSLVPCIDRDGKEVRKGVYSFSERDRILVRWWFASGGAGHVGL